MTATDGRVPAPSVTDVRVRPIEKSDLVAVAAMVHDLAAYENAADQCRLRPEQLGAALHCPSPALYGHVAVGRLASDPEAGVVPLGFALWFLNFSTWEGRHGIHLEDLYVRPEARGAGLGRALLAALAETCVARGYPRLEWWVLDWNPAREFYHGLGARAMPEWVPYRIDGAPLTGLADVDGDRHTRRDAAGEGAAGRERSA